MAGLSASAGIRLQLAADAEFATGLRLASARDSAGMPMRLGHRFWRRLSYDRVYHAGWRRHSMSRVIFQVSSLRALECRGQPMLPATLCLLPTPGR